MNTDITAKEESIEEKTDSSSAAKDEWSLDHEDLDIQGIIEDGFFRKYILAELKSKKLKVCVEACKKIDEESSQSLLDEARMLKKLKHPNIIQLIGVCTEKTPYYIVLEYLERGDLKSYLKKYSSTLKQKALLKMCLDVSAGLSYLNEMKCLHCSIASHSCSIGGGNVKITSFTLSKELVGEVFLQQGKKTVPIKWCSPEILSNGEFSLASDVWSFGILVWEIFSLGSIPYPGMINREVIEFIANGGRMSKPDRCPSEVYTEVMMKCWNEDRKNRPKATELHEFFDSLLKKVKRDSSYGGSNPVNFSSGDTSIVTPENNLQTVADLTMDNFDLDDEDLDIQEAIGEGGFRKFFRAELKSKELKVCIEVGNKADEETTQKVLSEARLLKKLKHPNIIRLIEVCTEEIPHYIVLEFLEGGSLGEHLRKFSSTLKQRELMKMCCDVSAGLAYLQEMKCLHREISSHSCSIGKENVVKITNFGAARVMTEEIFMLPKETQMFIKWTAPEALYYRFLSLASDIWSFGVVVWEIFSFGRIPYPGMMNNKVMKFVETGGRMANPDRCPLEVYNEVMWKCWDGDFANRPKAADLHEFFDSHLKKLEENSNEGKVIGGDPPKSDESSLVTSKKDLQTDTNLTTDKWSMDVDDIEAQEFLEEGIFCNYFKAEVKSKNLAVCVKMAIHPNDETVRDCMLKEASLLKTFSHPNIVNLIGVSEDENQFVIVVEYMERGSLKKHLENFSSTLTQRELLKMCLDVCAGLVYLEEMSCFHGDIAAHSCYVDHHGLVKISNFLFSMKLESETAEYQSEKCALKWASPEQLHSGIASLSNNIWSFGVLVWEVFSRGMSPYPGMTNEQSSEFLNKGKRMRKPANCPNEMYTQVMIRCWNKDGSQRPKADELYQFIESVWKKA